MHTTAEVEYDPFTVELNVDPYPAWKRLRDELPVYYNERFDFWALSRYDDVRIVRIDHEHFISSQGVAPLERIMDPDLERQMLIEQDPPIHSLFRRITAAKFTPRAIQLLESRVRGLCEEFLAPLVDRSEFDWVQEFAKHVPMMATCYLLGIDRGDQDEMRALFAVRERAQLAVTDPSQYEAVLEAEADIKRRLLDIARQRRLDPRDDIISDLVHAEVDDPVVGRRKLTEHELGEYCLILFNGGNSTTMLLMGWSVYLLAKFPAVRDELRRRPERIADAIEEFLRYEPVSHVQGRVAIADYEVHGETIPAGSKVFLLTGSACRDERHYDNPDVVDIDRKVGVQMGFGMGIHTCIGANLARLEGRIAIEEALKRFGDWQVDEPSVGWRIISSMRGYNRLPVRFG